MDGKRSWTKTLPGRTHLRPLKRVVVRPPIARLMRRRTWERKWRTRDGFAWEARGVPAELGNAVADRWLPPGSSVLDLGCGDGTIASWLASQGFTVHGIDFSQSAITKATEHHSEPGVSYAVADVSVVGVLGNRRFDALVDRGCLHCIPPQLRLMYARNVAAWAKPDAPMLLTMVGGDNAIDGRRTEVEALLGNWFTIESVERVEALAVGERTTFDGVCLRLRRG